MTRAFEPALLCVEDNSDQHRHHEAMKNVTHGETHFAVRCVADAFAGRPMLKRHRAVHSLLAEEFNNGLHALELELLTPAETVKQGTPLVKASSQATGD